MMNKKEILSGNIQELAANHRGWFMGHFIEGGSPLKTGAVEVKWGEHWRGEAKELQEGNQSAKSLAILIRGKFIFFFPGKELVLEKEGDFVFYDEGVDHGWKAQEDSLILTIRWPSV
jgi:hypothetical protein